MMELAFVAFSMLIPSFVVGEEVKVTHINSTHSEEPMGIIIEMDTDLGSVLPPPEIMGGIIDAMIAPVLTLQAGFGPGPVMLGGMQDHMNNHRNPLLNQRHHMFGPHSSLMRHPHMGHCHEDHKKLCGNTIRGHHHGGLDLIAVLSCLAENHHHVSTKCQDTVTMSVTPCIGDIKKHCEGADSITSCMKESLHKFSSACNKSMTSAAKHPAVMKSKTAPEHTDVVMKSAVTPKTMEMSKAPEMKKTAKMEETNISPPESTLFAGIMESKVFQITSLALGACIVALAACHLYARGPKNRRKVQTMSDML